MSVDPKMVERFKRAHERVEALEAMRDALEKPFLTQMRDATAHLIDEENAAYEELEAVTDSIPEFLGRCETCNCYLFEGDSGFRYADDAIYYCAEHAPDYAYVVQNVTKSGPYEEDEGEHAERLAALKAHDPSEKCVWVLP